jgi:sulfide:quinone oxidoreductase
MILVNEYQQSTAYPNIFGVGVCVSIPSLEKTLVPTGPPKTGYMIESQGTAAIKNIRTMIDYAEKHGDADTDTPPLPELKHRPLLNGLCITDFGQSGAIFLTLPQYPPRRTDITIHGKVAVLAKIAFEKYFLHKVETGDTDPYYEKYMLRLIVVDRVTTKSTE